jgi:hypothetical protein
VWFRRRPVLDGDVTHHRRDDERGRDDIRNVDGRLHGE